MILTIALPLPVRALSPNARVHWSVKSRAIKAYRQDAFWASKEALQGRNPPNWIKATLQAVFTFPTNRVRDGGNFQACLKAAIDGIADAGIVKNDSGVIELPPVLKVGKDQGVVITIQEQKGDSIEKPTPQL